VNARQRRWKRYRDIGGLVLRRPSVALRRCRYLFILGHMRSRSSLLSHILGSHPDISGYAESHVRYDGRLDFIRLRYRVREMLDGAALSRYVLDKVLHSWYLQPALLERMEARTILLVREPAGSMRSLASQEVRKGEGSPLERSLKHYRRQLDWLEACAAGLSRRPVFIESSSLLGNTPRVLELLRDRLALSEPLSERYDLFKHTGRPVYGDPSDIIRTGTVVRDAPATGEAEAEIPAALLDEARRAYEHCVSILRQRCEHIG